MKRGKPQRRRSLARLPTGSRSFDGSDRLEDYRSLLHAPALLGNMSHAGLEDELLQQAKVRWQQGDWQALAGISIERLENHPLRARLALLVAASHQQLGQVELARQFAKRALTWGCHRRAVAQLLISGIHASLARAAAIDQDHARSVRHADAALEIAYPGQDIQALRQRLLQTPPEIAPKHPEAPVAAEPSPPPAPPQPDAVSISPQVKTLRRELTRALQPWMQQQALLIESYLNLFAAIEGRPLLPPLHGWAITADLAAFLMNRLIDGLFDAVLEFGSGSSTVVLQIAADRCVAQGRERPLHMALEHDSDFADRTRSLLQRCVPRHTAQVSLAPLVALTELSVPSTHVQPADSSAGEGPEQPDKNANTGPPRFYDCDALVSALASKCLPTGREPRLLVLVDGPPANVNAYARMPALDVLLRHFHGAAVECIVDDYARPEERAMVQTWRETLIKRGRVVEMEELALLKHACVLRW